VVIVSTGDRRIGLVVDQLLGDHLGLICKVVLREPLGVSQPALGWLPSEPEPEKMRPRSALGLGRVKTILGRLVSAGGTQVCASRRDRSA
jgi:hypothetical protein